MKSMSHILYILTIFLLSGSVVSTSAVALGNNYVAIEEVIVTAQKRSESIQDVPISISALSEADINKFGIIKLENLRGTISGLEIRRALGLGTPSMTIRGVGSTTFDTVAGPVVTTIIDDIPTVSVGQLNFDAFDMQSMEVLKGPQGTIFGAGTTAGVIQMNTKKPTREFEAYVKGEVGDYGLVSAEGAVGGPLGENWAGRISLHTSHYDGVYDNTATGEQMGGQESYQGRVQLLYEDENKSVLLGLRYQEKDTSAYLYDLIPLYANTPGAPISLCAPAQAAVARGQVKESDIALMRSQCVDSYGLTSEWRDGPYEAFTENFGNSDDFDGGVESFGVNLRADIEIGEMTLTSVTGYDDSESGGWDPQGYAYAFAYDANWLTKVEMFSQELRLSGSTTSGHKWIAGVSYMWNEIDSNIDARYDSTFQVFANPAFIFGQTIPATLPANFTNGFFQGIALTNPILGVQDTNEVGVFGQIDWVLSDELTLITGLRWQHYEKDYDVSSEPFYSTVTHSLSDDGIAFNVGLNWNFDDASLLYAKVSQGIKSGSHYAGFSFSPADSVGAEQEKLLSYEIGLKRTWLENGSLQTNISVFYYDYEDLQSTVFSSDPLTNTIRQVYTNVGDADVLGVDAELTWVPVEPLFLKLSYTYLDTEITDSNGFQNFPGTNQPNPNASLVGNELSTAPSNQLALLARYTYRLSDNMDLSLQYNMSYTGDQWRSVDNEPFQFDEATTLHNVNVTLAGNGGQWEISAWGKNLSDELDMTWQFVVGGIQRRQYYPPRTYGVNATFNW